MGDVGPGMLLFFQRENAQCVILESPAGIVSTVKFNDTVITVVSNNRNITYHEDFKNSSNGRQSVSM